MLKALVVEDSLVTQRLVFIFLKRMGFEVKLIDNGVDAIKILKNNHFDAVFLDVIMPEVDGYSVCKFIKSRPITKSIPVIMLTSKNGMFDKVRGKMSGADVYLVKPINHCDLINAVNKFYPITNGILDVNYDSLQLTKDKVKTPSFSMPLSKEKAKKPSYTSQQIQNNKALDHKTNKVISLAEKIKQDRIRNNKNKSFNESMLYDARPYEYLVLPAYWLLDTRVKVNTISIKKT